MKRRKAKKMYKAGTLITVRGTSCIFMSLGFKGKNELDSFNGINIATGELIRRCDGIVRLATKREKAKYWEILKRKL